MKSAVINWRINHIKDFPEEDLIGVQTDLVMEPCSLDRNKYFFQEDNVTHELEPNKKCFSFA